SSTPGPEGWDQTTRACSLHSDSPGSCSSTCTTSPIGAALLVFTKQPPCDTLVLQPENRPCRCDESVTISSWCSRGHFRLGSARFVMGAEPPPAASAARIAYVPHRALETPPRFRAGRQPSSDRKSVV